MNEHDNLHETSEQETVVQQPKKEKLLKSTIIGIAFSVMIMAASFSIIAAESQAEGNNQVKDIKLHNTAAQIDKQYLIDKYSTYFVGQGKDLTSFEFLLPSEENIAETQNFLSQGDVNAKGFSLSFNKTNSTVEVSLDEVNQSTTAKDHDGTYTGKTWHLILNQIQYWSVADQYGKSSYVIMNPQDTGKALAVIEDGEVVYNFMDDRG